MKAHGLPIPRSLQSLIDSGAWPRDDNAIGRQQLKPILGKEQAHRVSPDHDHIILMPPPFHTIQDEVDNGNTFWTDGLSNTGDIDYTNALIVADFGIGSDSPIILYYRTSNPIVMYLKWSYIAKSAHHAWVQTHESFDEFAQDVGLKQCLTEPSRPA